MSYRSRKYSNTRGNSPVTPGFSDNFPSSFLVSDHSQDAPYPPAGNAPDGGCISLRRALDPGVHLKEKNWQLEFHQIELKSKRKIYDKKPFKAKVVEGKTYKWCSCGFSHTQPFCDGTHSVPKLKITFRPLIFKGPETKEMWFCNCKKTANPPFCDGTHRSKEVQDAFKD